MADFKPPKVSPSDVETLQHQADLLHLFHHRNKNQHRRSIWWRHFSIFRKQLNLLVNEFKRLKEVPTTHLDRTRKKASDKKLRATISQRLGFWQDILVVKWQNAFSQLVADGRFAQMGLVLLAVLARVCTILGVTAALEDLAQSEVQRVLDDFGREFAGDLKEQPDCRLEDASVEKRTEEDVGVLVAREDLSANRGKTDVDGLATTGKSTQSSKKSRVPSQPLKPLRTKRKRGDAIDELFSSLD